MLIRCWKIEINLESSLELTLDNGGTLGKVGFLRVSLSRANLCVWGVGIEVGLLKWLSGCASTYLKAQPHTWTRNKWHLHKCAAHGTIGCALERAYCALSSKTCIIFCTEIRSGSTIYHWNYMSKDYNYHDLSLYVKGLQLSCFKFSQIPNRFSRNQDGRQTFYNLVDFI